MLWIAPPEKDAGTETLEDRLWAAADQLRATSGLTSAQYSQPVLGLIFLRFAEVRFLSQRAVLEKQAAGGRRGSRVDDPSAYQAEGILYLTPHARFDHLDNIELRDRRRFDLSTLMAKAGDRSDLRALAAERSEAQADVRLGQGFHWPTVAPSRALDFICIAAPSSLARPRRFHGT